MNRNEVDECQSCRAAASANSNVSDRIAEAIYRADRVAMPRLDLICLMRAFVDALILPVCRAHDPRYPRYVTTPSSRRTA